MLQVIKHKLQHLYQINRSGNSSALVLSKNLPFYKKVDKICFEWKSVFFAFSHLKYFFVTHGHIPALFNYLDLILSDLSHSQSPLHSKTYLQILETKTETHFTLWQSWGNLGSLYLKRTQILTFSGTKSCLKEKLWLQTTISFRDSESCMS